MTRISGYLPQEKKEQYAGQYKMANALLMPYWLMTRLCAKFFANACALMFLEMLDACTSLKKQNMT